MAAHALRTWREAVVVLDHAQRDADLARLQYQNLLMQRAAYAQCVQSKQESAATIIWQSWRRLEYSLLARTMMRSTRRCLHPTEDAGRSVGM